MSVIPYIAGMGEFVVIFGNEKKVVDISLVKGAAGISYHILVAGYYQGSVDLINCQWLSHLNRNTILTGDDVTVIISMIQDQEIS